MNDALHPAARRLIDTLRLRPHPEGGWFRETWRADGDVSVERGAGRVERAAGTAIYYLLAGGQVSRLHRLAFDEVWHWYAGSPLRLHLLLTEGRAIERVLGPLAALEAEPQIVVPGGTWFGAEPDDAASCALVGCTVAPGFAAEDWELGDRAALTSAYPGHAELIRRLTPPAKESS